MNEDGTWGNKEKKIPLLDPDGMPVIGRDGKVKMTDVSTTGWSSRETLREIRKAWADINNETFEKKGLPQRIDWRSYEERGIDQIPTIHEGPAVRRMERRGIKTAVRKLNRMIRATNGAMQQIREMIAWINVRVMELKNNLQRMEEPNLASYLSQYYEERNRVAEAYAYGTKKAQKTNLQEHAKVFNFLINQKIHTPEILQLRIKEMERKLQPLSQALKEKRSELKENQSLLDKYETWKELKVIQEQYGRMFFGKKRFYQEHEKALKHFFALDKELEQHRTPDGRIPRDNVKCIHVHKTESRCSDETKQRIPGKRQRKKGCQIYFLKDSPKTEAGDRYIPLPTEYQWLWFRLKSAAVMAIDHESFGNVVEKNCVFAQNGYRLHTEAFRKELYKVCDTLEISRKSPHKIRKTFATILLDSKADGKIITGLMGHTELDTTETFYHRNRKTLNEKQKVIDSSLLEFKRNA